MCTFGLAFAYMILAATISAATTISVSFNAGLGGPLSYTESGLTVTSAFQNGHLHLGDNSGDGSPDLQNHGSCCSTPYIFTFSGGTFTPIRLDVVGSNVGPQVLVSSLGDTVTLPLSGTFIFPSVGWTNITSFQWNSDDVGNVRSFGTIDNFEFVDATPLLGVTPTSGSTLAFGPVLVGTTNNGDPGQNVNVENTGGGTLTGSYGGVTNGFNPTTAQGFSLPANATDNRVYNFAPTLRGAAADTLNITSDGGNAALNLTGQGVAPVADIDTTSANAGNVRIGTSGTASVSIDNIGDGNLSGLGALSNLNGSLAAAAGAPFSGTGGAISLADATGTTFNYAFTPTAHGDQADLVALSLTNGHATGSNAAFSQDVTLAGRGVGPEYQSIVAPGGLLDFGQVNMPTLLQLQITNATTDPNFGNLTDLTLISINLAGAAGYSLPNFLPGTVLAAGDIYLLDVLFDPTVAMGLNPHTGTFTILTDQGAAFGNAGQSFTYELSAIIIPEPATGTLLALASLCLVRRGKRR